PARGRLARALRAVPTPGLVAGYRRPRAGPARLRTGCALARRRREPAVVLPQAEHERDVARARSRAVRAVRLPPHRRADRRRTAPVGGGTKPNACSPRRRRPSLDRAPPVAARESARPAPRALPDCCRLASRTTMFD